MDFFRITAKYPTSQRSRVFLTSTYPKVQYLAVHRIANPVNINLENMVVNKRAAIALFELKLGVGRLDLQIKRESRGYKQLQH
jgi:hypothetical protein